MALLPPESFSNEYALPEPEVSRSRGPNSATIRSLLWGSCRGWANPPDEREFYYAMRATDPTRRQEAIAGVLISEGSLDEILLGQLEGAFTWRQLVRMMHRRGNYDVELARYVNLRAEPQ